MPDNAPIVQVSDSLVVYRASALGGCVRALLAARQGQRAQAPPERFSNEEGTGIYDLGTEAEDYIIERLIERGFHVHHRQQEVELSFASLPGVKVVGHIDGLTEPNYLPGPSAQFTHLLELKSFGPAYYARWKADGFDAFPRYAIQVSTYQYALKLPDLCMVIHNHDTGEFDISFMEKPPRELWQIETILTQIEELFKLNPDLAEVYCTQDYPCPYYYLHDLPSPLPPEAIQFALAMDKFDQKIKDLEKWRDEFKERLRALDVDSYQGITDHGEIVRVSIADGSSTRLDTAGIRALLEKANVPMSEYEKKVAGKKRVTVTVRRPSAPS